MWLSILWFIPGSAAADQIILGGNGVQFSAAQKLMLQADGKVMHHDYSSAENLYSQVIAMDGNNIDAYLQRGIIRREMKNTDGAASDGQTAVTLANAALQQRPNDPNLYYKRGMGFRLIRNFDQAKKDIAAGINLGGPEAWKTDLQAVILEAKEQQ